jgi:hypothetical protein
MSILATSPALAMDCMGAGATRTSATPYFLLRPRRYIYAGDTALHIAAAVYDIELGEHLLVAGADPTVGNRRGATPLHAASSGNPDSAHWNPDAQATMIARLVDAGADPNLADKSGVTPLHTAVRTRCAAAVRALLERGAEVEQRNRAGSTPLALALQTTGRSGSGSDAARREQAEIIGLLLESDSKPTRV